ncbi:MAG TPA: exosortase-associated EpsI family protein [Fimbriimonadaceae bacterium]|nr:exosortase-associated EpsI family protein [Fimbriimonadaceae bacterium]
MERLKVRAFATAGVLLLAGMMIQLTPAVDLPSKSEEWLIEQAPAQVDRFTFVPGPSAGVSYDVHPYTYEELKPFGVVGRIYNAGDEAYDVLLISSNRKESFHDQRVCFSAQGWTLTEETQDTLETHRGRIPITLVKMTHRDIGDQIAVYFYKGPGGFHARPNQLTWAMFKEQFFWGTDLDSVFYRFIPVRGGDKDKLYDFIRHYLKAADESSGGYY